MRSRRLSPVRKLKQALRRNPKRNEHGISIFNQRSGPGGRNRVYSSRDRTRLKLTLRAKRLGLSLVEAKELIDMYDSPRDTGPQLKKFMVVLAEHRQQLESQLADLHATLEEVKTHEKDARNLLARSEKGASKKVSA
jgi:DNA-binding transcriptional MerR regulator